MTFCWLDQLRRIIWKELDSLSPFCGRQDIRFLERKLRFARILSNTSDFTCHKDNVGRLGPERKQAICSIPAPKTCNKQIREFLGASGLDPQLLSLGKTPL
jgi:hypothetical protein